jgi:hypothetical protein
MIDWEEIAEQNNLSPEDFAKEIFYAASCLGAMRIEEENELGAIRFSCSDESGPIELIIRRPK